MRRQLRTIGVVLLNLGGPESPAEVEPFLRRLFADRAILPLPGPRWFAQWVGRRIARARAPHAEGAYRRIGGRSPLGAASAAQAAALEARLAARDPARRWRCRVAMRYWHPTAEEALAEFGMVDLLLALPLYPQYSSVSTGSSWHDLAATWKRYFGTPLEPEQLIADYATEPGYIAALADTVREALAPLDPERRDHAVLLFSAHSVPWRVIEAGDPYVRRTRETIAALRAALALPNPHAVGWQSRAGPVCWQGPSTEAVLTRLAAEGRREVLAVPVSFTSDHVETRYEIDALYGTLARRLGIAWFARSRALNLHAGFIDALADLALRRVAELTGDRGGNHEPRGKP